MQVITVAAAALALAAPLVEAANAIVYNQCSFPVYLWSVTADSPPGAPVVLAPGTGKYSEAYQRPSQGGVSIKIASSNNVASQITQFEYTLDGFIWYDLSNINCKGAACPFQPFGMSLSSGAGCPTVSCPAGQPLCTGAYNNPDDNWASLACQSSADTIVNLCASTPTKKDDVTQGDDGSAAPTTMLLTATQTVTATVAAQPTAAPTAAPAVQARAVRHPHARP